MLAGEDIPLETWNRFAQLGRLPPGLDLHQLLWADDKVWIVEPTLYEIAEGYFPRTIVCVLGDYGADVGHKDITGRGPNGGVVTYQPDATFRPKNTQAPRNAEYRAWITVVTTVVVEILHSQEWSEVEPKVQVLPVASQRTDHHRCDDV